VATIISEEIAPEISPKVSMVFFMLISSFGFENARYKLPRSVVIDGLKWLMVD
jgi:hypothetical protein